MEQSRGLDTYLFLPGLDIASTRLNICCQATLGFTNAAGVSHCQLSRDVL